jgi:hypothetical protein
MGAQRLIDMGFYGYREWPDLEAENDFAATGGVGKGGGGGGGGSSGGGDDYLSGLIQTLTQEVVPQALEFDMEAARAAAEQEWSPYYDEILQDYLSDVSRVSGVRQERIGGEFADRGLYQSGQRQEAQEKQLEEERIQRERRERDLAREREAAVTGQVETLREEKYYGYS